MPVYENSSIQKHAAEAFSKNELILRILQYSQKTPVLE